MAKPTRRKLEERLASYLNWIIERRRTWFSFLSSVFLFLQCRCVVSHCSSHLSAFTEKKKKTIKKYNYTSSTQLNGWARIEGVLWPVIQRTFYFFLETHVPNINYASALLRECGQVKVLCGAAPDFRLCVETPQFRQYVAGRLVRSSVCSFTRVLVGFLWSSVSLSLFTVIFALIASQSHRQR